MNNPPRALSALFFSRGRGHGHAIPDLEILEELKRIDAQIEIQFVSYATGAETFRRAGHAVIDLGLPENNSFVPTLQLSHQLIRQLRPNLVVAHEEFAALIAAKLADTPSIFISAWLPEAGPAAEALACAASILVIDQPGIFAVPAGVTVRPHYVGPILRKMKYSRQDRAKLRQQAGIAEDATLILVAPGGWASEERAPIADVTIAAFQALPRERKRLCWLSAKDHDFMREKTAGLADIEVIPFCDPIERLLAAADVVITKGTRGITLDAASLGVPSISLSPGLNRIDDMLVPRIRSNLPLNAKAVDAEMLRGHLERITAEPWDRQTSATDLPRDGAAAAAKFLVSEIRRLCE